MAVRADVSEQPFRPILRGQAVQEECYVVSKRR
jgi:hypothetical protein